MLKVLARVLRVLEVLGNSQVPVVIRDGKSRRHIENPEHPEHPEHLEHPVHPENPVHPEHPVNPVHPEALCT